VRIQEKFGSLPLYFVENQGQTDACVAYYVQGRDTTLYFTSQGIRFVLSGRKDSAASPASLVNKVSYFDSSLETDRKSFRNARRWVLKLDFVGANPKVKPVGEEPTEALFSYFNGPPEKWKTGLRTYATVTYRDLWPDIDLVFTGTANRLKYRFLVKPGADPANIRLAYRGATSVAVNEGGQLEVKTPIHSFHDDRPYAYQEVDGRPVEVESEYAIQTNPGEDKTVYGFKVGSYDTDRVLIVDPAVLVYCGFIGGSKFEIGFGIAVDRHGNSYITGGTSSTVAEGFPAAFGPDTSFNGFGDAFVAKVNASGTALLYCGYIGGDSDDWGSSIAVDQDGNAYVTGSTKSSQTKGFPVITGPDLTHANPSYHDAFVAKVNWSGTALLYCGYIGGRYSDSGYGIAVDGLGNAYVTGSTISKEYDGFPVTGGPDLTHNGQSDAFVAKVDSSGANLVYCGYIGGNGGDTGRGIAVSELGNVYITGETTSSETDGFPVVAGPDLTQNGFYDAFVAKVNTLGTALLYSGYIGGSNHDYGTSIAVDRSGCAYVTGSTRSTTEDGFPAAFGPDVTYNGGFDDAFVAKVNASGRALLYCGYIGGGSSDSGKAIDVDSLGNAYVVGVTASTENQGFPILEGPDLTYNGGETDAFVAKVYWTGIALVYCGYIGGSGDDQGNSIAVSELGNVYITGQTTSSETDGFPVVAGPDLIQNGSYDAFVAKVADAATESEATPWIPLLLLDE